MQASMRVMPCCFITGQAAGIAASVYAETLGDSHSIDASQVQERLLKMGAYLPNYKKI